jgi:prepilin-type N-terminal cleavage/methylation domain-containing protein
MRTPPRFDFLRCARQATASNGRLRACRGFTLLEVMVAVGVIGLIVVSMYRLVESQLTALRVSRESQIRASQMEGLTAYVRSVLAALPLRQNEVLRGISHQFGMAPADEMQWIARPGLSLLSAAAPEEDFMVTLTVQPAAGNSRQQDLGIRRRQLSQPETTYEWIVLLPNVVGLQFAYFHPALGTWLERWEDGTARPALVRMRVWRELGQEPFEVVLPVPSYRIQ